ncbi:tetratricopeptide repeat protein [Symmachiella dynata]|uniref:tetratricopeptide repeat protein n=1 Tax=Symmachiella dynata TaxID=2527995 RepID=UPI0011A472E6|nr:hypothetical protein [Symmachiella dynata]
MPAKAAVVVATEEPLTEDEAKEFFGNLEKAIYAGDIDFVANQMIDWNSIWKKATVGFRTNNAYREARTQFLLGGPHYMTHEGGEVRKIVDDVAAGGAFDLLRLHVVDGERRMLLRSANREMRLRYLDVVVGRNEQGQPKILDIYLMSSGELISTILRREIICIFQLMSTETIENVKLDDEQNDFCKNHVIIHEMFQATTTGDFDEASRIYAALPDSIKTLKYVMLARLQAAWKHSDDAYLDACSEFRKVHSNDPCVDFATWSSYFLKKDHAESLAAIDRIDQAVHGDPYLAVVRAYITLDAGDVEKAAQFADQAIAADHTFIDAYWVKVRAALDKNDFQHAYELLCWLEDECRMEFDDLASLPECADFIKSEYFQKWQDRHAQNTGNVPAQPSDETAPAVTE